MSIIVKNIIMGIEDSPNTPSTPDTRAQESEAFDGPVYDRLQIFGREIRAKLANDHQYDSNGHWSGSIKRLNLAAGKDQVAGILEINGWDADVFPEELLNESEGN